MYKDLKVLFVGIPDMAYVCLDGLIKAGVNIVGVIGAKKTHNTYLAFKDFVLKNNLKYIEFDELTDKTFLEEVKSLDADIAVVCSFNYKIPKELLDCVKGGFINTHPALLPDYRGPNPYSSVIINGEDYTGVTLHFMDENFDTGDIISQKKIRIFEKETMGTIFNKLNALGLDMLIEALELYSNNAIIRVKQPEGKFKYASRVETNIIDFENLTATEAERFIRALNPYIIAKTHFRGLLLSIFSAEVVDEDIEGTYGSLVKKDSERFYIKTKDGLLAPTSVQFGGFFISTSKEFISLINPQIGEVFTKEQAIGQA
ncbi:methionyl-tRNA formyltransferase [bacterium]|nr:methionyl-tRNA formyltransferase [bacterium]